MLAEVLDIFLGALRLALVTVVSLFLPVILPLLALFLTGRSLHAFAKRISMTLATLLSLIGTPIHEFSHAIGVLLTFSGLVAIKPLWEAPGAFTAHLKQPSPPGRVILALAPLFGGMLVLWLTALYVLPGFQVSEVAIPVLDIEQAATLEQVVSATLDYLVQYTGAVVHGLTAMEWTNWRTFLGLYIALSIGAHFAPGKSDVQLFLAALPVTLFFLYTVFVIVYLLGDLEGRFLAVQQVLLPPLLAFSTVVIYALLLTFFGLVLCLLLWFLKHVIWG